MKKILLLLIVAIGVNMPTFAQRKKAKEQLPTTISSEIPTVQVTSATDRLAGYEQRKQLASQSIISNLSFRNIGPTTMSGRVVDIEANPQQPTEFYVAYASGGLWKTINNGQSFEPLFDNEAVMTIGDIAVDWKSNTIWVGTGENNSSRSSYSGVGMYKSTDGGKSWQHIGLSDSHHIGRIALHPTNPDVAWVAAIGHLYSPNDERGIFKTTDGGKSWKKVLYSNTVTGAIDLKINPTNANELYASMWHRERSAWNFLEGGEESGIYKSIDGGDTWKLITTPTSGFPQGKGNGRIGLAIYPKNPSIVYAVIDNQAKRPADEKDKKEEKGLTKKAMKSITKEAFLALADNDINEYLDNEGFPENFNAKQLKELVKADKTTVKDIFLYTHNDNDDLFDIQIKGAELYRSEDGGASWKKANDDYLDGLYYTYGYYFGQVWVAPDNDQQVVLAGVPIIRSENGGKTFEAMDKGNVHSDHHALWINPANANHYILGNDGGINITYDKGKTWFKANSLPVGQFYAVAVDMAKPYNVYGGLQDNGVWYGPSTNNFDFNFGIFDEGDGFKFLLGGDGMQVQVDWRDNATLYTGFQFGNYFRINKTTGERTYLEIPRKLGEEQLRFNWESPIHLSRHNQDILYFGSHKFHRSLDKGDSWQTLSGDLTRGKKEGNVPFGTLTSIEESPKRFGLLYVGSDDGLAHVSKDGGYSWEKIADKPGLWCVGVVPSAHHEATVYAAFNGYRNDHFKSYLFASTDYGKTWTTLGGDLPAEPVNVVREDPVNENILYVGTDHGLYISLDKGATFHRASSSTLPAVSVHDLQIHPRENELLVGTHGRSLYIADIKPLQALTSDILAKNTHLFVIKEQIVNPNWGRERSKFEETPKPSFKMNYYAKEAGKASLEVQTTDGVVLKKIEDAAEKGLNTVSYDLTVDAAAKDSYEVFLNKENKGEKIKVEPADDKKLYILAGKYKIKLAINGAEETQDWEVKARKRPSRRGALPQGSVSPDAFEEWYEEMGFENGKK